MVKSNCDPLEVHHYERRETKRPSRIVERTLSDSRPPRRGTEIPGWYRQMYSEMGNPQSMTPILIKHNRPHQNIGTSIKSIPQPEPLEITHYIRLDSPPNRSGTSNSYETESSRSSTSGRDRSMSPTTSDQIERNDTNGGVIDDDEPLGDRQEYYPFRDAHHGKPLPGDNGFMNDSMPNNHRRYESVSPRPGLRARSKQNESKIRTVSKSPTRIKTHSSRSRSQSSSSPLSLSRSPNRAPPSHHYNVRSSSVPPPPPPPLPSGVKSIKKESIPYTMTPEYFLRLRHIKVTSIPVPIPPKFGTLTQGGRWPNVAHGPIAVGPSCHLCKDPIIESRFIHHEKFIYHSWHFTCSHCFKTLAHNDFRMSRNQKPYCNNCFKRENTRK